MQRLPTLADRAGNRKVAVPQSDIHRAAQALGPWLGFGLSLEFFAESWIYAHRNMPVTQSRTLKQPLLEGG